MNETFEMPLVRLLTGFNHDDSDCVKSLKDISDQFSLDSDGLFWGCIGALDGLAVRIKCPTLKEVPDPGNFFCRKNFYALNVQALCDIKKQFLWVSTGHHGCTHDSTAFSEMQLHEFLLEIGDKLKESGFFLVGDSAYSLAAWMHVPFDDAEGSSSEDAFNFWQSNSRICIEVAFGELIKCWGIFWRCLPSVPKIVETSSPLQCIRTTFLLTVAMNLTMIFSATFPSKEWSTKQMLVNPSLQWSL